MSNGRKSRLTKVRSAQRRRRAEIFFCIREGVAWNDQVITDSSDSNISVEAMSSVKSHSDGKE